MEIPSSLTEFGSIGAVLAVVWFFLNHIKEERKARDVVMGKVTEAFNRNTEALARTERVLESTETVLKDLRKESK